MQQATMLCDHVSHVFMPFPSLSGPEGPVNQVDKPNRFLLAILTGLKVPGRQADYALPYRP